MTQTSRTLRTAVALAGASAALVLGGCGSADGGGADTPEAVSGTAGPVVTGTDGEDSGDSASPNGDAGRETHASEPATADGSGSASHPDSDSTKSTGGKATERCHTSELRASVGPNHPGAGQENFAVVFTNSSQHTCTLRGYPGAAFAGSDGKQVGSDPERTSGSPSTITLEPGASAWAGLSFSNPEISGAKTAEPASLLVTPPNERDSLTLRWTGGEVPVSGNASKASVSVLARGTGA
ncbi:DUF4232 domain-containing protein [Streptomyces sp. NPDC093065]|uniref:DUF4232 domain-containing protein n=1 Tax=Streptomyces sp. NPDC093065 TaxID=3366021 RepID=UPI0038161E92